MDKLIQNFSIKSVTDFFKSKISSFSPNSENLDYIIEGNDFINFSNLQKVGEVAFNNSDELIVFTCKFNGLLSERSSKKRQFEIAKKVLKEDFKDGAIFIFYDENNCFRFSFIRKNYGNKEQKFTNWKRYTYFVDPSKTNKTFKNRINGCNFSSLEDIQEAFSVEKLNKKFYEEIATAFYSLIGGKVNINKKEQSFDACLKLPSTPVENRKVYQEFAVRLIGRTIFCWFLKNKKSDSGIPLIPEEWLSSNMVASVNNDQHNYYHAILEKLFFLVLNKKVEDRKPYVLPNKHELVPFLNGGLFEAQEDDFFAKDSKGIHQINFALNIPNDWFLKFFETLEQYNFTIDENSINDFEVSIDPEMLGTIFENLLAEIDPDTEKSARKSTGSFYTPREIVDYMVEQSLLQYIKTKTNIEDEEQLEILLKDDTENPFNIKQTVAILEALSEVKILDPACGSGAFPMGVLHKIITLLKKLDKGAVWWKAKQLDKIDNALVRKAMEEKLSNANSDYIRKLGVIQHSIYGVDIQPIAAEISKLRSFLSLIIDENIDDNADNRGIEPLPNLEFKFVTANTLLGLDEGAKHKTLAFDFGENDLLQDDLQIIRNNYLQASPLEKEKLRKDFEKLQIQILKNELKSGGQNQRAQQLAAWKPFSNESSEWFDPKWMFGFDKFDVVIGNPPYVNVEKIDKKIKDKINSFKTAYQKYDLYVLFYEKGIDFLKDDGVLNYITSNKFLSQGYGLKLRQLFLKSRIDQIVNFNYDVFESATVRTCIFQLLNSKILEEHSIKIIDVQLKSDKQKFENREYSYLFQSIFNNTEENNFRINLDNHKINLLKEIEKDCIKIEDICSVNYGLRPSSEKLKLKKDAFIFEHNSNKEYKKYFEGKDMGYWLIKSSSYLDYRPDVMYNAMFPELFENEKLVGLRTLSDIGKLRFIYDDEGYYCNDSVVVLTLWNLMNDVEYSTIKRNINSNKIKNSNLFSYQYLQAILNSRLIKFYVNELLYDGTHFYPNHMKCLPIKNISLKEQEPLRIIVDYILWLEKHKQESINNFVKNDHIVKFFEEILDALVYEVYFKKEFVNVNLEFSTYVLRDCCSIVNSNEKAFVIHEAYQKIKDTDNEIRNNLKLISILLEDIIKPIKNVF